MSNGLADCKTKGMSVSCLELIIFNSSGKVPLSKTIKCEDNSVVIIVNVIVIQEV